MVTKQQLINFETKIGDMFNNKMIKAPIHLYSGNEDKIMEVFKRVDVDNDWILCTWRNHYQALLKGIPEDLLTEKIIKGKSMVLNLPQYKFICSSIVGGIPSIAAGIAYSLKLQNKSGKVWCWLGDMSAETGHFHEAYKFSKNHKLPITYVIEDNGLSVLTPTSDTWKRSVPYYIEDQDRFLDDVYSENKGIYTQPNMVYYAYRNDKYPHAGAGQRVQF